MNSVALVCKFKDCNLIYEKPITLPCGNSLCKHHLDHVDQPFVCQFCKEEHQIPQNGFAINKTIIQLIETNVQFIELRKEIDQSFDNLNTIIEDYESIDSEGYVYDHFAEIRNQVDLHREQMKKQIDDKSDEIIKQLKEKEDKCRLNAANVKKMSLTKLKADEIPSWKKNLRTPSTNKSALNDLSTKIKNCSKRIEKESSKYKRALLMKESVDFHKDETVNLFGKLKIEKLYLVLSKDSGKLVKSFNNQHKRSINSIQVDLNSNKLISLSEDKTIKIWNLVTGDCLGALNENQDWVTSMLLIPNNRLVSGSWDKSIKIWDLNTNQCLSISKNESVIISLCLISDNQIALGCENGFIYIRDLNGLTKIKSFKAHENWIPCLSLVNKTKLISCSGHKDNKIKIWDLETYKCIKILEGHSDMVRYLEVTSDGDLLSCSDDKTVKQWDIETGELLETFKFNHSILCVKALDDDLIAVGLQNGEMQLYSRDKMQNIKSVSFNNTTFIKRIHLLPTNGNFLIGLGNGEIKLVKIFD